MSLLKKSWIIMFFTYSHRFVFLFLFLAHSNAAFGFFEFFKNWSDFNAHMRSAVFSNSLSNNNTFKPDQTTTKALFLNDIKGVVPNEIYDLLKFYKGEESLTRAGAKKPRGILLVGAPGTGKTSMVRALAHEAKIPFIFAAASEFVELYVGNGAKHVRELFQKAKDELATTGAKHAIIFIDEIDALGVRDSGYGNSHIETRQTINELLTQMDGFKHDERITVIGATNRADFVDSALKRPGRFDYVIEVPLPDYAIRRDILKHYLLDIRFNRQIDSSVNIEYIAKHTNGLSGADLEGIVNKAALNAARANRSVIKQQDLLDALEIAMNTQS
jgi:cell division protease FtsH